ncbi:MAG: MerR family DNA-binding protein [Actinomycetota bacterium]|nr:MerR family DNA-binding protein [Actinomycetota bacterium]
MSTASRLLPIGDVARRTGVAVSAVRYYDEIGMITAVGRVGGKRRFDLAAVGRVNFVRRAQEVGFSLQEIRSILDEDRVGWQNLVDHKLAELTERRNRLDTMIEMLAEIRECGCESVAACTAASQPATPASRQATLKGSSDAR